MQKISLILILFVFMLTKLYGQWTGINPISTNSSVGIGTSYPNRLLEISSNGTDDILLQLTNQYILGSSNEPTIRFDNGNGGAYWDIGANVSGQEYFRIRCNSWQNGNVLQDVFFSMVMEK